jgi:hypothetical protein
MSETKFTDGPWNWEHDQDTASMIQVFSESSGDSDVCRLQHEPDAHLIAAAPEMYEMLQEFYETLGDEYSEDLDKIEILLTKARGEK